MKPIELKVKAFGQYLQEQTVRFDRLDQVFLITGETGSGKTTLFDAISYALYGVGLGSRAAKLPGVPAGMRLRSQLAGEEDSTVVRFQFAVRGTEWRVERSPYQFVKRKPRGGAEIDRYVTLHRVRGTEVLETIPPGEVDDKLGRLIGLRHEDFSKILVLPQGEFQQFLAMSSDKRADLLKTLFPVDEHTRIAQAAKDAVAEIKNQLKALDTVIRELRSTFDDANFAEREQALQEQVSALQAQEAARAAASSAARDQLQLAITLADQHRALADQQKRLRDHSDTSPQQAERQDELALAQKAAAVVPALHAALGLANELRKVEADWSAAQADESQAGLRHAELQPQLDALGARRAALQQASVQVEQLGQRLQELARLRGARKVAQQAAGQLKTTRDTAQIAKEQLEQAKVALRALDAAAEARAAQEPALRAADAEARQCKEAEPHAEAVESWGKRAPEVQQRIQAESHRRDGLQVRREQAALALDQARERLRQNAALAVASSLRPGEPCLACGSRDHPHPHQGNPQDGDLIALEKAAAQGLQSAQDAFAAQDKLVDQLIANSQWEEQAAQAAGQRLVDAGYSDPLAWRAALHARQQRHLQLRAADQALADQLAQRPSLNNRAQALEDRARQAQSAAEDQAVRLAGAEAEVVSLQQRTGAVADVDQAVAQVQDQLSAAQEALRQEESAIKALQAHGEAAATGLARCKALREGLELQRDSLHLRLPEAQDLAKKALAEHGFALEQAALQAQRSPAQMAELNRQILQWDGQRQSLRGAIDTLTEAIGGRAVPDVPEAKRLAEQAAQQAQQATELRTNAQNTLQDQRSKRDHLAGKLEEYRAIQKQSDGLLILSQHLNGDIAPKIDFATWMLTWWLEQVLLQANRRMTVLSDSRYAFALRTTVQDGRARAGLDVDVIDSWSNQRRDVNSLSGGEKFLASLSLALGLADVVQGLNGGVQLDTLFIDEGFGSLDAGTLDRAMDLINRIAEHRAVGLISHVEAMQKAITSQIRVRKSPQGSQAEVATAGRP